MEGWIRVVSRCFPAPLNEACRLGQKPCLHKEQCLHKDSAYTKTVLTWIVLKREGTANCSTKCTTGAVLEWTVFEGFRRAGRSGARVLLWAWQLAFGAAFAGRRRGWELPTSGCYPHSPKGHLPGSGGSRRLGG